MAGPRLEGTLAIIKPDAYSRRIEIEEIIMKEGFLLVEKKRMRFTKELAEEFYEDRRDEAAFPQLIGYMTSGDCMVLCLGRENGISHWRSLIGPAKVSAAKKSAPKCLRAVFGDAADDTRNAVHGSESPGAAGREIDLIFPNIIAESEGINFSACVTRSVAHVTEEERRYLARYVVPSLQQGLAVMYRTQPEKPLLWLADWLRKNNPQTSKLDQDKEDGK